MRFGSYWDPRDGGRPYEPQLDLHAWRGGEVDLREVSRSRLLQGFMTPVE
jgi:hypothetical protein